MSRNLDDDNMPVTIGPKLVTKTHGLDTLNEEHAHDDLILLAGTIFENHNHNHNIININRQTAHHR